MSTQLLVVWFVLTILATTAAIGGRRPWVARPRFDPTLVAGTVILGVLALTDPLPTDYAGDARIMGFLHDVAAAVLIAPISQPLPF